MLIIEGEDRGNPALRQWSLGFESWLVLGSPRPEVQQKNNPQVLTEQVQRLKMLKFVFMKMTLAVSAV